MKTAMIRRYGPASEIEVGELPIPVPGKEQLLVRARRADVFAASRRRFVYRLP